MSINQSNFAIFDRLFVGSRTPYRTRETGKRPENSYEYEFRLKKTSLFSSIWINLVPLGRMLSDGMIDL